MKNWNLIGRFHNWYIQEIVPDGSPWYIRFEPWLIFCMSAFLSVFLFVVADGLPFWRHSALVAFSPFFMFSVRFGIACQSLVHKFGRERPEVMSRALWELCSLMMFPLAFFSFLMALITEP